MKKVETLFPELCNIYGEFYNVEYLQRCAPDKIEVIRTSHKDTPYFSTAPVDMIYLGCTTERKQEEILELLRPYKNKLQELIENDVLFLVTGNAIEIFGKYIEDGERVIEGLGIFDFYSERYMKKDRHNSQFVGKYKDLTLLGHKSQFSFAYGDFENSFIELQQGTGMNPDTMKEGIQVHNFYGTYSLGPFLILNPHFTKMLLEKMDIEGELCFEQEIIKAYEYRLNELCLNAK